MKILNITIHLQLNKFSNIFFTKTLSEAIWILQYGSTHLIGSQIIECTAYSNKILWNGIYSCCINVIFLRLTEYFWKKCPCLEIFIVTEWDSLKNGCKNTFQLEFSSTSFTEIKFPVLSARISAARCIMYRSGEFPLFNEF